MEFFGIKNNKTHEIDSESYKIEFLREHNDLPNKLKLMQKNIINIINKNQAYIFKPLTSEEWNTLIHCMTSTHKHIVKMIINGHARNNDSNLTCETFNKAVFAKLLSHFPFDNKILLVENLTCFGVSSLGQNEKLEYTFAADTIAQNARSRYETIMKNKNNDIISMGVEAAKLSNGYYRFYYGGTDERDIGKWDITYLVRKTNAQEDFWNMNDYTEPNKKEAQQLSYIETLHNDLIEIKNKEQNIQQLNNNQYNNQYNLPPQQYKPPYGGGNVPMNYNNGFPASFMQPANIFPPQRQQFVPQQPYYPQMQYSNNNNNNIPSNKVNNYINPVSLQSQQYQPNTNGAQLNDNMLNNNKINTNNGNVINNAMMQGDDNNISFQDNLTGKNNETVFCDLTKGFCLGRRCW